MPCMSSNKNKDFLEKIILLTKSEKILWGYLDANVELCDNAGLRTFRDIYDEYELEFDPENGFFACLKDSNIFLIIVERLPNPISDKELKLIILPNTFRNRKELLYDDYGEQLTRLLNVIKSQFPNPDDFIDEILKM